jgi:hypothetical protein
MRLFSLRKIENIKDIEELFTKLTKRKHWKHIPDFILRKIFDNAEDDIEKIQRFRFISEMCHCVEKNFVPIVKENSDPEIILCLFSVTLERLAAQSALSIPKLLDRSKDQDIAIGVAEIAYMSSILCNPFMLPSYGGLACFYMLLGSRQRAAEICQEYDIVEEKLIRSNKLNYYDQATKLNVSITRQTIDEIKTELKI